MSGHTTPQRAIVFVLLLAVLLRTLALADVPPGWRDDEVIETTVHAQRVLDGEWPLFFVEAEGHEPLFHYVTAGWIALVGNHLFLVRLVSAMFGLLAVAISYRLAGRWYGRQIGLWVALLLAVSFWALMYSRTKIRHISTVPFALLALADLYSAYQQKGRGWAGVRAGLWGGITLYTYFAALGLPLIFIGFGGYLWLFKRRPIREVLQIAGAPLVISLAVYAPLLLAMQSAGGSADRLTIVGAPLLALLNGDPLPTLNTTLGTLMMFTNTGDPEALYNIPGRPVFWVGVGLILWLGGVLPLLWASLRKGNAKATLLLGWWAAGLSPAFVSIPSASIGHAILALPATYLILVLAAINLGQWLQNRLANPPVALRRLHPHLPSLLLALILLATAARDLPDYFIRWPADPLVRLLYRADLHTALTDNPPTGPVLVAGPTGLWDVRAFLLEPNGAAVNARWIDPNLTWVYPAEGEAELWLPNSEDVPMLSTREFYAAPSNSLEVRPVFENGWQLLGWSNLSPDHRELLLHILVTENYQPPPPPIGRSPEPPDQPYRLFLHVYSANGEFLAGVDRMALDTYTLRTDDIFVQLHDFPDLEGGTYYLQTGIYHAQTGERLRTTTGETVIELGPFDVWER